MAHNDCIFCKIIAKELPAKVIAESETAIVIQDIAPKTPIHYLIIPKKHVSDITQFQIEDRNVAADLLFMAKQISEQIPEASQFRLVVNNGPEAGQVVFHLHFHFCAGKKLSF